MIAMDVRTARGSEWGRALYTPSDRIAWAFFQKINLTGSVTQDPAFFVAHTRLPNNELARHRDVIDGVYTG